LFDNQHSFDKKNFELFYKKADKQVLIDDYNKRIFAKDKKTTSPVKIIQTEYI
jgi:hypothetical protein